MTPAERAYRIDQFERGLFCWWAIRMSKGHNLYAWAADKLGGSQEIVNRHADLSFDWWERGWECHNGM